MRLARARGVTSFVDAVQAPGRLPPTFEADVVAYSAHKFGGPAGVGILAVRRGAPARAAGARAPGRRAPREARRRWRSARRRRWPWSWRRGACGGDDASGGLRDRFERTVRELRPGVRVHGAEAVRLANTSNVCFPGVDAETVLIALDLEGFAVSVGAACASGTMRPSPVLLAMGVSERDARGSIRISFGRETTEADVTALLQTLERVLPLRPETTRRSRATSSLRRRLARDVAWPGSCSCPLRQEGDRVGLSAQVVRFLGWQSLSDGEVLPGANAHASVTRDE